MAEKVRRLGSGLTKRCPFCKSWVPLPLKRAHAAFEHHKAACDPAGYAKALAYRDALLTNVLRSSRSGRL